MSAEEDQIPHALRRPRTSGILAFVGLILLTIVILYIIASGFASV